MTFREIKKLLEADGWRLVRVCGSHNQFRKAGNPYAVTVPNHGSRSISIGVIKDLEKRQVYLFGGRPVLLLAVTIL